MSETGGDPTGWAEYAQTYGDDEFRTQVDALAAEERAQILQDPALAQIYFGGASDESELPETETAGESTPSVESDGAAPASTWATHQVAPGTVVFHVTKPEHAISIARDGVQQVENQWGGGRLGQGFYTHTNEGSAGLYFQGDNPVTLEFRVIQAATGRIAPQNVDVSTHPEVGDYVTGNAFITAEEDTEELKFHSGDALELVAIWQAGQSFTPEVYLSFLGESSDEETEEETEEEKEETPTG